jgi:hypothetical protein
VVGDRGVIAFRHAGAGDVVVFQTATLKFFIASLCCEFVLILIQLIILIPFSAIKLMIRNRRLRFRAVASALDRAKPIVTIART